MKGLWRSIVLLTLALRPASVATGGEWTMPARSD